eukprot:3226934-Prymnesium_polylepis.1
MTRVSAAAAVGCAAGGSSSSASAADASAAGGGAGPMAAGGGDGEGVEMKPPVNPASDAAKGAAAEEEGELCSVCLCDYDDADLLIRLPCGHLFHEACVERWLRQDSSCPHCRYNLLPASRQPSAPPTSRRTAPPPPPPAAIGPAPPPAAAAARCG